MDVVERNWGRIGWGALLILIGGLLLADRLGALPPWAWHYQWWAVIVIALGLGAMMRHRDTKDVGNGVMFVLLGTWFLLVSNDQFGLTWHNSWPLALVAAGAGTIARAISARWLPDRRWTIKEEHHA